MLSIGLLKKKSHWVAVAAVATVGILFVHFWARPGRAEEGSVQPVDVQGKEHFAVQGPVLDPAGDFPDVPTREGAPLPGQLAGISAACLDERWRGLSGEVGGLQIYERVSLWEDAASGVRWRAVQLLEWRGRKGDAAWHVRSDALMAADRFVVARIDAATDWEELRVEAARRSWSMKVTSPNGYVALVWGPAFSTFDLNGLESAFEELAQGLEIHYRVGWSHLFSPAAVPNDPQYGNQWSLPLMGAPAAWNRTTGSDDLVVAVIDTGVEYAHPDLAANIWMNPGEVLDGTDTDGNGFIDDIRGWDFANDNNDPSDFHGHGTGVAGVVGAVANNTYGIAGVAWNVKLMVLRVGSSNIPLERLVDAIDYAIWQRVHGEQNVVAINISLGGRMPRIARDEETPFFLAVRRARDADILCVFAAGNDNTNNDALVGGELNHFFPSDVDLENVISVAGTNPSDVLYSSSNYGPESVTMAAPALNIQTTNRGGGFGDATGTSFAAPHVSGAAVLIKALNPHLNYSDIRSILLSGSTPLEALEGKVAYPVRLSLSGALDEGARWPRIEMDPEWIAFPFLNALGPQTLAVRVTAEGDSIAAVEYMLGDEVISASGAGGSTWEALWSSPSAGSHEWTVAATSSGGRHVDVSLPAVRVLNPFSYWQATQFGENFEEAVAGYEPQGEEASWSLAERFVFGLGLNGPLPPPLAEVPAGRTVAEMDRAAGVLQLRFWQNNDALHAPLKVLTASTLAAPGWSPIDPIQVDSIEVDTTYQRVLMEVTLPAPEPDEPRFYRLQIDLED